MKKLAACALALLATAACTKDAPPPQDTGPRPIEATGPVGQPDADESPLKELFGGWRGEYVEGMGEAGAASGPARGVRLDLGADRVRLDGVPLPAPEKPAKGMDKAFDTVAERLKNPARKAGPRRGFSLRLGKSRTKAPTLTKEMKAAPKTAENLSSGYRIVGVDGDSVTVQLSDRLARIERRPEGRLAFTDLRRDVTMVFVRTP